MKIIFLTIIFSLILAINNVKADNKCATPQCEKAEKINELPADVTAFVQKRDGCDYFRGEPWPEGDDKYSTGRRQFIQQKLNETCSGTDIQLKELHEKYQNKQIIKELLTGYENKIESR